MSSQGLQLVTRMHLLWPVSGKTVQLGLLLAVTAGSCCLSNLLLFIELVVDIVRIFMTLILTVSD